MSVPRHGLTMSETVRNKGMVYLLNGNSNARLTTVMARLATRLCPETDFESDTVSAAPRYISTPDHVEMARQHIIDHVHARLLRRNHQPDAILLACFGEPGLIELRERIGLPIVGMLEAGIATAMQSGRQFAILTTGAQWPPMLADLIAVYGVDRRCAGIETLSEEACARPATIWKPALRRQILDIAERTGADVVIVGGGPVSGRGLATASLAEVIVIDAFAAALVQLSALAKLHAIPSRRKTNV